MPQASRKASTSHRPASRRLASGSYSPLSISPSSSVESLLAAQVRPRPLKVVIIGPASVGKSTLRQRYFTNRFQRNYKATIGTDFEAKVVECKGTEWATASESKKGKGERQINTKGKGKDVGQSAQDDHSKGLSRKVLLTVWDTAGQERFRALGSAFYRGADAVLICFDASAESASEVQQAIAEWYTDFQEKSGMTPSQVRAFCWVAVGCQSDMRRVGAVRRSQVRQMLNSIVARSGIPIIGSGQKEGDKKPGNELPADPRDVLAREGIHEEDDLNLKVGQLRPVSSGSHDVGSDVRGDLLEQDPLHQIDTGARPGEKASKAELDAGRDSSSECQDKDHNHLPTPREMMRSGSDSTDDSIASDHTVRKEKSQASQDNGSLPFPKSSPPASAGGLTVPPGTPTSKKSGHLPRAGHGRGNSNGTAPIDVRSRYDSNISLASSAHLSIYHTPRNSEMYASGSSAGPTESGSPSEKGGRLSQKASNSTLGKVGQSREDHVPDSRGSGGVAQNVVDPDLRTATGHRGDEEEAKWSAASPANGVSTSSSSSSVVDAGRRRSLSTASRQTVARSRGRGRRGRRGEEGVNGDEDGEEDKGDGDDGDDDSDEQGGLRVPPSKKHLDDLPSPPRPRQGFSLFYTSSLDGTNVQALFEHIISRCAVKWDWEEYHHHMEERRGRRRSRFTTTTTTTTTTTPADRRGTSGSTGGTTMMTMGRRRSLWNTLRFRGRRRGEDRQDDEDEVDRLDEEMRRMVRLSDGKGDDQKGGCC